MQKGGRAFLIPTAILVSIGTSIALTELRWGERFVQARDQAGAVLGAWALFGGVGVALALLALWSVARPARAAEPLWWSAAAMCALGVALSIAWRGPLPPPGSTLGAILGAHEQRAGMAASIALLCLQAASALACLAAVAFARRARRAAASTRAGARVILVAVIGVLVSGACVAWGASRHWDLAMTALPLGAALVALPAGATLVVSGEEGFEDAARAAMALLLAGVLGVASAWLASNFWTIGPVWHEVFVQAAQEARASALQACAPFSVLVALVLATARPDRAAWRAALRASGPVIAVALGAAVVCVGLVRGAFAAASDADRTWALPPLADAIADEELCWDAAPASVVTVGARGARVGAGDWAPAREAKDLDALATRLESAAPQDDVWLAVEDDDAPFATLGGVLAAVGRARGVRAGAVSRGQYEVAEGCAARIVGRGPSGDVMCSEPLPLVGACFPEIADEQVLWVVLRDAKTAEIAWRFHGQQRAPATTASMLGLEAAVTTAWTERGDHRDPYDRHVDHAVVAAGPDIPARAVLAAVAAVRAPRRGWYGDHGGRAVKDRKGDDRAPKRRAALIVSVALAAP